MFNEDGFVEVFTERRLLRSAEVVAEGDLVTGILQQLDRIRVIDSWEWEFDLFAQEVDIALQLSKLGLALRGDGIDDVGDHLLLQAQVVFVIVVGHLTLGHPEFS